MIITNESFMQFLTEINAKVECPVCSSIGWSVSATYRMDTAFQENDIVINHLPYAHFDEHEGRSTSFVGGTPVLFASCDMCGYIRLHSYKLVQMQIALMSLRQQQGERDAK
ncbi:hypothetical protein [Lelliottia wanjuensis]|uniref:Uncharacterized protein n=1 Tax=Lelliottia wanjuensis TaxID=3050585 RepID=A0AAP4FUY1_9ENTR|nr:MULTISPECIES: hypothetical protein [unclassified Lelliottia]MDK9364205.1 hypothetical protein [Lelliottia sp. V106_12]MDK9617118.1 hypothetical protein [Lelliottia sp. V106_9]